MRQQGVVPDKVTYSVLMEACKKRKQPQQALEVLQAIRQQGGCPMTSPTTP